MRTFNTKAVYDFCGKQVRNPNIYYRRTVVGYTVEPSHKKEPMDIGQYPIELHGLIKKNAQSRTVMKYFTENYERTFKGQTNRTKWIRFAQN